MNKGITPQFLIETAEMWSKWRDIEHRELLARVPTTAEIFKMIEGGWKSDAGNYDYVHSNEGRT